MPSFHEVRFPTGISLGAQGGPERRTDIVVLGSGHEERNSRWSDSRRRYNAGYGVKSLDDLAEVVAFFEERRGRLYGFRWRDALDWKSCAPSAIISPLDQLIGTGDGTSEDFPLVKIYGRDFAPWSREIRKPVEGSVRVAVAGVELPAGSAYTCDPATGRVIFTPGSVPAAGAAITAGFAFDVPVRFDTDHLEINRQGIRHGAIPSIPVVEIRS
ncbi:MAG: TIGR02217 family protein [Hyphomicrobiaceae bacterium]